MKVDPAMLWLPRRIPVHVVLPYDGVLHGVWWVRAVDREAAFDLAVELRRRMALAPWNPKESLFREALSSFYSYFATLRLVEQRYGRALAATRRGQGLNFSQVAGFMLDSAIRPLTSTWHPLLEAHEVRRRDGIGQLEHQRTWPHADDFVAEVVGVQVCIAEFAQLFRRAAGVRFDPPGQE